VRTLTEPMNQEARIINQTTSGGLAKCGWPPGRAGRSQWPWARTSRAITGNRVSSFVKSRRDPKLKLRITTETARSNASRLISRTRSIAVRASHRNSVICWLSDRHDPHGTTAGRDHEATSLSQEAPMNVGVWIPNCRHLATPEIIRSTAVRAEHLGYDSIWVSDHVVVPHANVVNFGETVFDPLVTLAVVAGATSRVRLGTTVLIVPYRNPVVTAKMISSLDALSGGRFIL